VQDGDLESAKMKIEVFNRLQ